MIPIIPNDVIAIASAEVGYHEKVFGTPTADLYPKRNAYDGTANWTKYHHELNVSQGQAWCGFFLYWCFLQVLGTVSATNNFLHGITYYGGGVDQWYYAFNNAGKWHYKNSGYTPKVGDAVIFSDDIYTYSHVELIVDISGYSSYITDIGGNTRDPDQQGSQSEGMFVARRNRSVTASSGFHILGYCEIDYDGTPIGPLPDYMYGWILKKKKRNRWIW